jgi:hypothetical protein
MTNRPQHEKCSRCGLPFPSPELVWFYGILPFCPACAIARLAEDPDNTGDTSRHSVTEN